MRGWVIVGGVGAVRLGNLKLVREKNFNGPAHALQVLDGNLANKDVMLIINEVIRGERDAKVAIFGADITGE